MKNSTLGMGVVVGSVVKCGPGAGVGDGPWVVVELCRSREFGPGYEFRIRPLEAYEENPSADVQRRDHYATIHSFERLV